MAQGAVERAGGRKLEFTRKIKGPGTRKKNPFQSEIDKLMVLKHVFPSVLKLT